MVNGEPAGALSGLRRFYSSQKNEDVFNQHLSVCFFFSEFCEPCWNKWHSKGTLQTHEKQSLIREPMGVVCEDMVVGEMFLPCLSTLEIQLLNYYV